MMLPILLLHATCLAVLLLHHTDVYCYVVAITIDMLDFDDPALAFSLNHTIIFLPKP